MQLAANSQRVHVQPWLPILLLVLINLVIGLRIVGNYGISADEASIYTYSDQTLGDYSRVFHGLPGRDHGIMDFYGPAFLILADLTVHAFRQYLPWVLSVDVWHYTYFVTFQIAILSLYFLCRRWMQDWAAFGAAMLFATQPLLWGHAFINPKDIPFMGFFLASVAAGFSVVDRVARTDPFAGHDGTRLKCFSGFKAVMVELVQMSLKGFTLPYLLAAGALLGFTTSMRILGPLAGGLVALYAIYKIPRFVAGVLVPYFTVAATFTYLLWPYLWVDPLGRFIESLRVMSVFPFFGKVLFEGRVLAAADLPARYLPKMMLLQLTEPLILLFSGGVVLAVWKMLSHKSPQPFGLLIFWLLAPLGAIILAGGTVYDNFRQELFLIPPIFICAGLALDRIYERIRSIHLNILILALVVAPGIFAIVNLHPYEYIYYNQLIGGVRGAFRKYELDYWYTSYRDAAQILNRIAPPNSRILVVENAPSLMLYTRSDIKVYGKNDLKNMPPTKRPRYEYVVITGRRNLDIAKCKKAKVIASVKRDGAVLAVVKRLSPGDTDCPYYGW